MLWVMTVLDRFSLSGRGPFRHRSQAGLGLAFARALAEAGGRVAISSREPEEGEGGRPATRRRLRGTGRDR